MDAVTGAPLDGEAHLAQSVEDILTTPLGSMPTLRDYGSALAELVDAKMNTLTRLRCFAASAIALARWEKRLRITGFEMTGGADGAARLVVIGQRLDVAQANARTRILVPLRSA